MDGIGAAIAPAPRKDRIPGGNRMYNGPLNVTWYATGNNVQLGADPSRRVCHIRLESSEERPETRTDVTHEGLREHVRRNRGSLLSAALTILRGWFVAGKPRYGLKPWGSFESWSSVVREAIANKSSRIMPIFPYLRPYLQEAFDTAKPGDIYVLSGSNWDERRAIAKGKRGWAGVNLRTTFQKLIRRAGLKNGRA